MEEERWRLDEVFPASGAPIYQLSSEASERTLLKRFASKACNRQAAAMLLTALDKTRKIGIGRSVEIGLIRRLRGEIVEVKVPGSVVRGVSYQKSGENILVLLEVTRGHQGSGNMGKEIRDAGKKAPIVRKLIDETRR